MMWYGRHGRHMHHVLWALVLRGRLLLLLLCGMVLVGGLLVLQVLRVRVLLLGLQACRIIIETCMPIISTTVNLHRVGDDRVVVCRRRDRCYR